MIALTPRIALHPGDCLQVLERMILDGVRVDAICTDPPYHLTSIVERFGKPGSKAASSNGPTGAFSRFSRGFMGKAWDGGDIAFRPETWDLALQVLKPGGHLAAFSGTRTYHRMACAIEDAGLVIRDQLAWTYGSGWPKGYDVERQVAMATCRLPGRHFAVNLPEAGKRQEHDHVCPMTRDSARFDGINTALKPAWEPIALARKPPAVSIAANALEFGTGGLNIDACRIDAGGESLGGGVVSARTDGWDRPWKHDAEAVERVRRRGREAVEKAEALGRYPANLIHDGSAEVTGLFPAEAGAFAPVRGDEPSAQTGIVYGDITRQAGVFHGDGGSAARFFYCAKAGPDDRLDSKHPTVKPVELMRWLVRLITPPGGVVLDPFAGTGSTGVAALREGLGAVLIERDPEYQGDITRRFDRLTGRDAPLLQMGGKP